MNSQTIVMCVVSLILGMLLAHMLKDVCGCKNVVEGSLAALDLGHCDGWVSNWCPPGTKCDTSGGSSYFGGICQIDNEARTDWHKNPASSTTNPCPNLGEIFCQKPQRLTPSCERPARCGLLGGTQLGCDARSEGTNISTCNKKAPKECDRVPAGNALKC